MRRVSIKEKIMTTIDSFQTKYPTQMGFFYGLLSPFLFNCANYISRDMSARHPPFQIVYMFSFQMFVYNYMLLRLRGIPLVLKGPDANKLSIYRVLLSCFGCAFLFYAFPLLSYSEGLVIMNIGPVFSGILAVFFLGEVYDLSLFLNTVISLLGVILIAKPVFLFGTTENVLFPQRSLGILFILICTITGSFGTIIMKKLSGKAEAPVMAAWFGFSLSACFGILQIFSGIHSLTLKEYLLLIINGTLEASGQLIIGQAYKYGKATTISMLGYSRILYAYMTEIFMDGVIPDNLSIIGSMCIFSSLFVTIHKLNKAQRASNAKA